MRLGNVNFRNSSGQPIEVYYGYRAVANKPPKSAVLSIPPSATSESVTGILLNIDTIFNRGRVSYSFMENHPPDGLLVDSESPYILKVYADTNRQPILEILDKDSNTVGRYKPAG